MNRCMSNDGQLKAIRRIELTSDSSNILLHIETESGEEEVYNCPSGSPNYYHLRKLLSSEDIIPSDIVCGNTNFFYLDDTHSSEYRQSTSNNCEHHLQQHH